MFLGEKVFNGSVRIRFLVWKIRRIISQIINDDIFCFFCYFYTEETSLSQHFSFSKSLKFSLDVWQAYWFWFQREKGMRESGYFWPCWPVEGYWGSVRPVVRVEISRQYSSCQQQFINFPPSLLRVNSACVADKSFCTVPFPATALLTTLGGER